MFPPIPLTTAACWDNRLSPAPTVSVTENNQSLGGVPVTLGFSGPTGGVTGLGPVNTAAPISPGLASTGAAFSGLTVTPVGGSMLSATLAITGSYSITTNPDAPLDIFFATGATTTTISAPAATYGAGQVTVTVTSEAGTVAGNVSLTVDNGAPIIQGCHVPPRAARRARPTPPVAAWLPG